MKFSPRVITALVLGSVLTVVVGFVISSYAGRGLPFVGVEYNWAIGIYSGNSAFELRPPATAKNPVLTADHVTDVPARFVADPFLLYKNSVFYMFFEVLNDRSGHGDIGLATSRDGFHWQYQRIVLDEPFHLSYPYVFESEGNFFLVPESNEAKSVRLYRAEAFPERWTFVGSLLESQDSRIAYLDSSLFRYDGKWWLLTCSSKANDELSIYYASDLLGPWLKHPDSPVIAGDPEKARPGGRVVAANGQIFRYGQDDHPAYGNQLRAFEITRLATDAYSEQEVGSSPVLRPTGHGWNAHGMHHLDPVQVNEGQWIASVDGYWKQIVIGKDR